MSTNDSSACTFSPEDCRILSQLDSLEFGLFKPEAAESRDTSALLERVITYFDNIIAQCTLEVEKERGIEEAEQLAEIEYGSREEESSAIRLRVYNKYASRLENLINPKIYLLLGHFQLLLHRFDDAFSAYRKYELSCPTESAVNCSFLYGLGLCSFRFNAFHKSASVFQSILYLQPWFPRSKELHIRLGYIYKSFNNFERSLRHYRQALNDSTPGTFTRIEIRFHIAHLLEVCSKTKQAKAEYRQILELDKSRTPIHIRHLCFRQLAWLHHIEAVNSSGKASGDAGDQQRGLDVQLLQSALQLDSSNGRTWYLLGRCQAALSRVQEAFSAYRSSIDKTEASADTWCSIGVLYQEQSQPMDALQAYFCAVQLDKCHVAAWANLGTLYETVQQYKEALKCYKNAVHADKRNELRPEIRTRLFILQQIVPRLPEKMLSGGLTGQATAAGGNSPGATATTGGTCQPATGAPTGGGNTANVTKLPTVDDAWNLPIPSELTQRQMQLMLQEANSAAAAASASVVSPSLARRGEAEAAPRRPAEQRQPAGLLLLTPPRGGNPPATSVSAVSAAAPTVVTTSQPLSRGKRKLSGGEDNHDSDKKSDLDCHDSDCKRPCHNEPDSGSPPVLQLNAQQKQMLQTLQTQENTLTASQRQLLIQLQQQALRYHMHRLSRKPGGCDEAGQARAEAAGQNPSSLTGADLFPGDDDDGEDSDDLPVGVAVGGDPNLPEEDLNFLTDDLLAQLNRSEAAGSLDLVEFALFAPNPPAPAAVGVSTTTPAVTGTGELQRRQQRSDDRTVVVVDSEPSEGGRPAAVEGKDSGMSMGDDQEPRDVKTSAVLSAGGRPCAGAGLACPEQQLSSPQVDSSEPVNLLAYLTRPLKSPENITAALNISMTSDQILSSISGLGRNGGPWWPSLLPEGSPIPSPPAKPYPPPTSRDKLLPPTPTVYLESRKDAHAPELMRYCLSQPAVVVRGLANALRLDLGLFSTKSLAEANPDHRVEVRTQRKFPPEVNLDSQGAQVWFCESPKTVTTISRYAAYQAGSFIEALREEKQGSSGAVTSPSASPAATAFTGTSSSTGGSGASSHPTPGEHQPGAGDCEVGQRLSSLNGPLVVSHRKDSASGASSLEPLSSTGMKPPLHSSVPGQTQMRDQPASTPPAGARGAGTGSSLPVPPPRRPKVIRFGTNCDLSDEKKWYAQLHELEKLPNFVRVVSAYNMLSHVGYPLLGMNTVQLYLKVPGCRTPGHQENNCFSAVNINIGPGDCEWFAVPEQYWGGIHDLCQKNNVDYLSGSWWPHLETLYQEEIPVYRFIQRPGDLVWINAGSVHWVQAIGWCNNIAWNVGPLTARQYQQALERYEFNRLRAYKSIVPMVHFSWQLARNVKISDPGLYELVKQTLLRSLVQSQMAVDFVERLGQPIKRHGKRAGDVAHLCHDCEIEVFNLLYVTAQEKKLVVRCLDCARHIDAGLRSVNILSEYYMHELADIYDDFQLQVQSMTAYPVGKP